MVAFVLAVLRYAVFADRGSAGEPEDVVLGDRALALIGVIRVYQLVISPLTPPSCRYYPSCSTYAVVALRRHGLLRGGWLAVRRLARCHPWTPGGVDDVPPARPRTAAHPVAPHAHGAD